MLSANYVLRSRLRRGRRKGMQVNSHDIHGCGRASTHIVREARTAARIW